MSVVLNPLVDPAYYTMEERASKELCDCQSELSLRSVECDAYSESEPNLWENVSEETKSKKKNILTSKPRIKNPRTMVNMCYCWTIGRSCRMQERRRCGDRIPNLSTPPPEPPREAFPDLFFPLFVYSPRNNRLKVTCSND